MRNLFTVLIVLLAGMLAGCGGISRCQGPSDVGDGGRSIPPLRVPVGLADPNTKEALKVPELNEPERPRKKEEGCIDEPPSYFPNRQPGTESGVESGQPEGAKSSQPERAEPDQPQG